jgi:cell wall-associated NlpC family hydrolase
MRRYGLVLLCILALATLVVTAAGARSTPQIRAQQAHARSVLAQIDQIGRNLEKKIQQYDGARLQLQRVRRSLDKNQYELHVAKGNFHAAQKRLMARLYSLYVNGSPTAIDVIAGAHSVSQLIDRAESAQALSSQDAALGRDALRFERAVQRRERQLKELKRRREATVAQLASQKHTIQAALGRQKRLLASIHSEIVQMQKAEAAREARLKAAVERRLREEAAARRAAAQAAAGAPALPPPPSGVAPPPVNVPIGNPGVGHPQAAQIALRYLGVPYVWGGASPSGFDCSGLVMYVYAQLGISLPHYTVAQWNATEPIGPSQMEPGDLVFFNGLGHVGIYLGGGQFVDAPHTGAVVRIDSLSSWGGSFDGARRVP